MQSTKELLSTYYNAFNKQDMTTFLNCLDEDVRHDINQGQSHVGKQAFADFMKHMNNCYKEQVENLVVMVNEDGDRAAAEFTIAGTYLQTDKGLPLAKGQSYTLAVGAFFVIKAGKITRVTNYYNLQNWLQQIKE